MTYEQRTQLQKDRYEQLHKGEEHTAYDDLSPEDQAAICEGCGKIIDPEMPIDEGESVLCGGYSCDAADLTDITFGG